MTRKLLLVVFAIVVVTGNVVAYPSPAVEVVKPINAVDLTRDAAAADVSLDDDLSGSETFGFGYYPYPRYYGGYGGYGGGYGHSYHGGYYGGYYGRRYGGYGYGGYHRRVPYPVWG